MLEPTIDSFGGPVADARPTKVGQHGSDASLQSPAQRAQLTLALRGTITDGSDHVSHRGLTTLLLTGIAVALTITERVKSCGVV